METEAEQMGQEPFSCMDGFLPLYPEWVAAQIQELQNRGVDKWALGVEELLENFHHFRFGFDADRR